VLEAWQKDPRPESFLGHFTLCRGGLRSQQAPGLHAACTGVRGVPGSLTTHPLPTPMPFQMSSTRADLEETLAALGGPTSSLFEWFAAHPEEPARTPPPP
jgi:hypothetical protein